MKQLLDRIAPRCDELEIFSLRHRSTGVGFANNILKSTSVSQNAGIGIRLIKNGRLAQASSSNPNTYLRLLEKTIDLANFGDQAEFRFADPAPVKNLNLYNPEAEHYSIENMVEIGHEIIAKMKSYDPEVLTFCGGGAEIEDIGIVNSRGVDAKYQRSYFSFVVGGQLVEGKNIVFGYRHYIGLNPLHDYQPLLDEAISDLEIGRKSVEFKGAKSSVIFTPRALADILIAFQQGLDGGNVAKGTSPLTTKLGTLMFDPRFSLYDDPLHPEGSESNPFDDEGTACTTTPLVERGVLKNFILDRKSAGRLNLASTANGYRRKALLLTHGYAQGVSPYASNLIMTGGTKSLQQLLADNDGGLVVDQITGILLGNLLNGDFSGTIGLGFKVNDGKCVGRVKDVMISGNFYRLFSEQLLDLTAHRIWTGALGGSVGSYFLPWGLFQEIDVAGAN